MPSLDSILTCPLVLLRFVVKSQQHRGREGVFPVFTGKSPFPGYLCYLQLFTVIYGSTDFNMNGHVFNSCPQDWRGKFVRIYRGQMTVRSRTHLTQVASLTGGRAPTRCLCRLGKAPCQLAGPKGPRGPLRGPGFLESVRASGSPRSLAALKAVRWPCLQGQGPGGSTATTKEGLDLGPAKRTACKTDSPRWPPGLPGETARGTGPLPWLARVGLLASQGEAWSA